MIILASDYVGFKVVEYLVGRGESIRFLILDNFDRGGYNQQIEELYQSSPCKGIIAKAEKLKNPTFLEEITRAKPSLGILAWWPYILKGQILKIPDLGWLNFHPSYLPFNRGKHPNFWCLVDESPCGVTLHYVDEGIDTGDIVAQKLLDISWEDTGESIYYKTRDIIIELFKDNYDEIVANKTPRKEQNISLGSFHKSSQINKASQINLDSVYTARQLLNLIRARMFPPHPTAYFYDGGKKYSVQVVIKEMESE